MLNKTSANIERGREKGREDYHENIWNERKTNHKQMLEKKISLV